MIKEWIDNWKEKQRQFKSFDEFERHKEKIAERKLPHNERVLNTLLEEERQKQIKRDLKLLKLKRKFEEKKNMRDSMKFNSSLFKDNTFVQERMF